MRSAFLDVISGRRSYYKLTNKPLLGEEEIKELLKGAVKYTPTAYNSQLTRLVLLLNGSHRDFWDIVIGCIKEVNPGVDMSASEEKVAGLKNGFGTVLFYNDNEVTKKLVEEMPLYKAQFELWAHHANAMLQFSVWNILEEAGYGATLQHFNPIVDEKARERFDIGSIGSGLELIAQMPFGVTGETLPGKEFLPIESRFFVRE